MTIYSNERAASIETVAEGDVTWTNVASPGQVELEFLSRTFNLHPLAIADLTSHNERPKVDSYDGALFVVVHFAVFSKRSQGIASAELHVFVTTTDVVTVHDGDIRSLNRLFQDCQTDPMARQEAMSGGSANLLYRILADATDAMFPVLDKMGSDISIVERAIFSTPGRATVQAIATLRRDLIAFRRAVRPEVHLIDEIEAAAPSIVPPELEPYWDDVRDHLHRLLEVLDDYKDAIEALAAAHDAVANYRLNETIRILTIFSTVMLPLAVISGVYGMNVRNLPFAESEFAFEIVTVLMTAVIVGMLAWFRRRGWI